MPLGHMLNCVVFAFWVAVCAAAPEFIWRGLVILSAHLTPKEIYSALLIAMLLAFFVEPIMERIRIRSWKLEHQNTKALIYTVIMALAFGVAAVCVHEAMNAYLGGEQAVDHDKQANLISAIEQVREWASIPFVVTVAWFSARTRGWLAFLIGGLACIWVVIVGLYYAWVWRDIVRTAIPCFAIIALGGVLVSGKWDNETFLRLAFLTAASALCWFALLWVAQGGFWWLGEPDLRIYAWDEFCEDFRFYLGWSIGLAVAPNPVPRPAAAR